MREVVCRATGGSKGHENYNNQRTVKYPNRVANIFNKLFINVKDELKFKADENKANTFLNEMISRFFNSFFHKTYYNLINLKQYYQLKNRRSQEAVLIS